jgi:hypothetical protein
MTPLLHHAMGHDRDNEYKLSRNGRSKFINSLRRKYCIYREYWLIEQLRQEIEEAVGTTAGIADLASAER